MNHFRSIRYVITTHKVLSQSEQDHLIAVCARQIRHFAGAPESRDALILMLMLECGLRCEELLQIRARDFNPRPGTLFIRSVKGSNARELPVRHRRAQEIENLVLNQNKADFWSELDPDLRLFDISYQRLYQIWQFYTPNARKKPHSLRHTFAINFYMKARDIKAVQMALGHRNIQNTMVYVDFVYNQDVLRKLMHG